MRGGGAPRAARASGSSPHSELISISLLKARRQGACRCLWDQALLLQVGPCLVPVPRMMPTMMSGVQVAPPPQKVPMEVRSAALSTSHCRGAARQMQPAPCAPRHLRASLRRAPCSGAALKSCQQHGWPANCTATATALCRMQASGSWRQGNCEPRSGEAPPSATTARQQNAMGALGFLQQQRP